MEATAAFITSFVVSFVAFRMWRKSREERR